MAVQTWVSVGRIRCGSEQTAELLEQRVYATGMLDGGPRAYHVRARKCSLADDCREASVPCCWTGLNPNYDPFSA